MRIFTANYWKEVFSLELIVKTTLQTIIGTVLIGSFFMLFTDFIFKPADLNGRWTMVLTPKDASGKMNKCFQLEYTILIVQKGVEIIGGGEKEKDKKLDREDCKDVEGMGQTYILGSEGAKRIKLTGFIDNNYFASDVLTLSYLEGSDDRYTMGVLEVSDAEMSGWYESNISQTRGKITLKRKRKRY